MSLCVPLSILQTSHNTLDTPFLDYHIHNSVLGVWAASQLWHAPSWVTVERSYKKWGKKDSHDPSPWPPMAWSLSGVHNLSRRARRKPQEDPSRVCAEECCYPAGGSGSETLCSSCQNWVKFYLICTDWAFACSVGAAVMVKSGWKIPWSWSVSGAHPPPSLPVSSWCPLWGMNVSSVCRQQQGRRRQARQWVYVYKMNE